MGELKDFYVKEMGDDYGRIENSLWYLSELSVRGAVEIDNYILGRNHNFEHVQELTSILEKYPLKDSDTALTAPHFPYLPVTRAVQKDSDKKIKYFSELALEIKLLRSELEDVPTNSKKLEEFRSLLCDFSREFSNERHRYGYQDRRLGLVA